MATERDAILKRLAEADRRYQREAGGRFFLGSIQCLLGGVVLCFGLDVFLHLDAGWRLGLVFALAASAVALWGWSLYVARVRRNQLEFVARFLESRDPALGSKVINLLQLEGQARDDALTPLTRELAVQAVQGYTQDLGTVDFARLVRTPMLRRAARRAAWVMLGFAVLMAAAHEVVWTEAPRFADPFGDHPAYSLTQLEVVDPGPEGTNVVYGKSYVVKVKARGHQPKELFLTSHPWGRPEESATVPMFGKGKLGFYQQLDKIQGELAVYAHTKDRHSVSKKARLGILLAPRLERAFARVEPPAYTDLKSEESPYEFKSLQALKGSRIRFRLQSNRPLREGLLELSAGSEPPRRIVLERMAETEVAGGFLAEDSARLRFSLVDTNGIASETTWESSFTVTYDLPPEVAVVTPDRDSFVAMDFKVEARIEAGDDYGLRALRIHRGLNGVYAAPLTIACTNSPRTVAETVTFDIAQLGVNPGDTISLFAEAIDTAPEGHPTRSDTIELTIISVEQYNTFLRERSDIADVEAKYEELMERLQESIAEQKAVSAKAEALREAARKGGDAEALARELDGLLARQNEINQKLNQQAERMENFVRKDPLYDVERELERQLRRQAEAIRNSTATNDAATHALAQRSSLASGERQVGPDIGEDFRRASDEQLARLGGADQALRENVAAPLQDMSAMQELLKDFNQFESLYRTQQGLAEHAQPYNRPGTLAREDQLALRSLATTERDVAGLLHELGQKLKADAGAAEKLFPKAAASGRKLAAAMDDLRLHPLAREATDRMLAAEGDRSYAAAERLRSEMEKLFEQTQSGGNCPSCNELDQYLKLSRNMNPGKNFAQMSQSRKFGRAQGQGKAMGQGEGDAGSSGEATVAGENAQVLGNESMASRGDKTALTSAKYGAGAGKNPEPGNGLTADKADSVKGLNPVNRLSGAVTAESTIEEYSDVVEKYFQAITK